MTNSPGRLLAAVLFVLLLSATTLPPCSQAFAQGRLRERLRQRLSERVASKGSNKSGAEMCNIANLKVAVWEPQGINGPAPLVIFSHGFHGINVQSVPTTQALAKAGYLVMAPNHKDAMGNAKLSARTQQPLGRPDKWSEDTYRDRAVDISNLLSALQADPRWSFKIDWSRVGLMGHSLGGYTVLGLAGAWPSWRLPNIKAVVALSPYANPFNQHGNIASLNVPVMYQTGTTDVGVKPFLKGPNGVFNKTSSPAIYVEIKGANHFTWTNLNREKRKEDLINHYAIAFLDTYVKGDLVKNPTQALPGVAALLAK